jgi:lysophospholipase L1-like esterase
MLIRIAAFVLLVGSVGAAETTPPRYALAPPGQGENGDWAFFGRYREANAALKPMASRVVFMGDSITEAWAPEPLFAEHPNFVGRGLSGQTTLQMLVRFRADVIDLKPAVVHIMGGTNDLAGNNGPESDEEIEGALASMAELARANHIKVVLASIPPAADFAWHRGSKPIPHLVKINAWLKSYASRNGIGYVDYWPVLAAEDGSMKASCSPDGVHPNPACYRAMQSLTLEAIAAAMGRP